MQTTAGGVTPKTQRCKGGKSFRILRLYNFAPNMNISAVGTAKSVMPNSTLTHVPLCLFCSLREPHY